MWIHLLKQLERSLERSPHLGLRLEEEEVREIKEQVRKWLHGEQHHIAFLLAAATFFFFFLTICTVIPIIWNLLKCVSYFVVLLQQGMLFPDGNASEEAVRCGAATVLLRKFNPSVSDKVTSPWEHFWQMGGHAQPPVATLYFSPPTGLQWAVPSERPPFAAHHSFLLLSTPMATVHTEMSHVFHLGTSVFSFTPNSII